MKKAAAAFTIAFLTVAITVPGALALASGYSRIVSLAPNITETLYALGLGEEIAGVTRFCTWPPEACEKPEVGGLFDPNLEAIAALDPDLVLMLPAHERLRPFLDDLGIEHLSIPNETIPEIIETIRIIGARCGVEERASDLADSLEAAGASACPKTAGRVSPRVLIVVDRQYGQVPEEIFAAGKGTWYDELLTAAGGTNVLDETVPSYPMLSPEGLVHLQPDLIIEVVPGAVERGMSIEGISADWESFDMLTAVTGGRIFILTGRYAAVPGPRYVLLLEEFCGILHE
jgi:iron complex transport system substrate-binding protein